MKKLVIFLGIVIGLLLSALLLIPVDNKKTGDPVINNGDNNVDLSREVKDVTIIAENLEIPWDIAFLPNGNFLVTERPGRLTQIDTSGDRTEIVIDSVKHVGEGGLLGLTLHPNFEENNYIYLYMGIPGGAGGTINRVERYKFIDNNLSDKEVVIDNIPGAIYHDGGRIEFGPDGFLYITTGDATKENLAQDLDSLAGKILRIRDDGSVAVYSYGHRNPQGLAWDSEGKLWATEHGRSGVLSGLDEINLIKLGGNYGWPEIQGDERDEDMLSPVMHSGAGATWAPASAAYLSSRNSIFFGGLRGEALYEAVLEGDDIVELKTHFKGDFGRIRAVRVGTDKLLYITTSNRDGRGDIQGGDDKIIRINPASLE